MKPALDVRSRFWFRISQRSHIWFKPTLINTFYNTHHKSSAKLQILFHPCK